MKKSSIRVKRLMWSLLFVLLLVFLPYLYSRITAGASAVIVKEHETTPSAAGNGVLRVGTFNIAHGRGSIPGGRNATDETETERTTRLEAIGKLIREESLDIAVLNEVDFDSYWSHGTDQSEVIARAAALPFILKQRNSDILLPFLTLRFGNAILSRYPITEGKFLELPVLKKWENILGGAHHSATCVITLPGGKKLQAIPVHLEVRDEATRIAAAVTIAGAVSKADIPSLVLGDFNSFPAPPSQDAISTLTEKTGLSPVAGTTTIESTFTFPSESPDRRLDWIFVPPAWKVISWKIHSTNLSDHSFLTAVLDFPESPR